MQNNKLIRLLATLSRREMTRFREYALSPYFNKHGDIQALVTYLSEIHPHFDERTCDRAILFQRLHSTQPHDQQRLALVFTYTLRLLEAFLAQEQHQEDSFLQRIQLLQALRVRKQYHLYEKILQQTQQLLDDQTQKDDRYYHWRYLLAADADTYYNQMERRQTDHNIQEKQDNLDQFYILQKLKDACEMHTRHRILNVDYATRMLETVLQEVQQNQAEYTRHPIILIYYQVYRMLTQEGHEHYHTALQTLQNHEAELTIQELQYMYNYFQNYCIQQINRGEGQFLKEIFKLYQAQLLQNLLIEDDHLSEWHYKNIITVAIRLGEMEWAQSFIEGYKEKLPPEARENAHRFNLASYYYAAQQYDRVLELLLKIEYSDLRYNLGAKALLMRTYYDLEEYEALISLVQSFTLYLRRNKLMANSQRDGHYNLFKFTRRAAQIRSRLGYEKGEKLFSQLKKLQEDIAAAGAIMNKGWLLEKMQELEAAFRN